MYDELFFFFRNPRTGATTTSGTSLSASGCSSSDDDSNSASSSSSDVEDSEVTAYGVFLIRVCMFLTTNVGFFRNIQYEREDDPIRESRTARSSLELLRVLSAPEPEAFATAARRHIKAAPPCSYLGLGDDGESETETPEEVRSC